MVKAVLTAVPRSFSAKMFYNIGPQFSRADGGHVRHVERDAGRQPQRDLQGVRIRKHHLIIRIKKGFV